MDALVPRAFLLLARRRLACSDDLNFLSIGFERVHTQATVIGRGTSTGTKYIMSQNGRYNPLPTIQKMRVGRSGLHLDDTQFVLLTLYT